MSNFTGARALATYLKLASAGPGEAKQIIEHKIPRELTTYDSDGKVVRVRELLVSEAIESTTLIQTEMYNTVLAGAEPVKCMRQALPIISAKSNTLRVPLGEAGTYAGEVAEGAEIPIDVQDYTYRDFTIRKYGVRPLITKEMVEDGLYDVVALEVQKAGARIENKINQAALSAILQNSGNSADCGGSGGTPVAKLAEAIAANQTDGYNSNCIILHPGMVGAVMSAFTSVATSIGDAITRGGMVGTLLGCPIYTTGVTDESATYTWGWGVNDYIGGLVINRENAGAIAMRRDITVQRYEDPIRDLVGMGVTARFGCNYFFADAIARVMY